MSNPMHPDRFKAKPADLIRTFWYPPDASEETGIRVVIRYTSPAAFGELEERIKTRFTKDKRAADAAPATQRRELLNELLLHTVVRCEGATFGKLQGIIPLDPDAVGKAGGLDTPVPMDPENGTTADIGRAWLLKLLDESQAFSQFVQQASSNLSLFQSGDWRERVKNSTAGGQKEAAGGPTTSSAPA